MLVLLILVGCGRIGFDATASDAATDGNAADACPLGPFGARVSLGGFVNTTGNEQGAWLSEDRLELIFSSDRLGNFDLYRATRTDTGMLFGPPALIPIASSLAREDDPYVEPDGLTLWFTSNAGVAMEIYRSDRTSLAVEFGPPTPVSELNTPAFDDAALSLSRDGLTAVFCSASRRHVRSLSGAASYPRG